MRRVLCAGSAALGALCLLLALTGGSASAASLCSVNVSPCTGTEFKSGTKLKATATSPAFLSSIGTVSCEKALLEGETTSNGGTGEAVGATISALTFEGNCNLGATSCTLTVNSLPSGALNGEGGNGTLSLSGGELNIKCGFFINCTYLLNEVELQFTGGKPALAKADKLPLTEVKGFLCPKTTEWDIKYEFQTPESLYIVVLPGSSNPYIPVEGLGGGNPGQENIVQTCTGDPIDCSSGNLTEEQTDIGPLGGRGPALGITRSYNSQLAAKQKESEVGPYGWGWSGPYSARLSIDAEAETATVHHDNGSAAVFYSVEGKYYPPTWTQSTLKKSGENYLYTLPSQEKLEFDKSGLLVKITDRHGNALTLTYKEGLLETVKDAAGRALTFTYKEGKVESVKDPLGNSVKYTYESGKLATVTLPGEEKASWKFKYDASHQMTELTDGRGNTTKNEYDGSNRVKRQVDALERERKLEYKETETGSETTITEPNGSKTLEVFNEAGEPLEITRASGTEAAQTTKYEYSAAFELVKETDANNHATAYAYDLEGNRTSAKDANGNESKWTYNATRDVLTETTPRGNTTTITRNAAGDPETIKRPAPESKTQEVKFKWAANGDLEEETDPLGRKTTFKYDKYGNLEAETNPEGDKRTWGYDEDGRVTSTVSPRGNEEGAEASKFETKTKRDAQGRPEVVTDPLGHETKRKYDAAGNLEVLTNANGHATTYVYDAANQRTEVKAANGDVSKTAYDSMGAVKSKTDGNANTTKYERNLLGQLTETIDPLERKTIRKYDAAGNLKELKDAASRTTTFSYDAGDRLEKADYSEEATPDVTYKYDKDGNLTEMSDGTGTSKYAYDELGRMTQAENGAKEVVKYEYDLADQKTKITYPNGKAITRAYDKAGRLESVKDWLGGETKFAYDRDSMPKTTTFPSASENKDEYEYNNADELTKTTMKRGSETLASISYARDNAGQVKSVTQTGLPGAEKPEYEYDERERLKKGAGTSFGYDAASNPTKLGGTTLKYDKASQLEEAGTTKYAFNSMGQRTEAKPASGPVTKYGYDQAGNLISVNRTEEGEVKKIEDSYAYDGSGLRASQKISGTKAQFAWDVSENLPLLLFDGTSYYLYGPDGMPFAQIASEAATYLHHDHLGSTRMLTNSSGEAKGKYTYTPYGAVEEHTGSATTPLGFNGQYRNESTGLIYLRARVYDPETAQFLSIDPALEDTGEPYGYAGENPLNHVDPTGRWSWPWEWSQETWEVVGAVAGVVGGVLTFTPAAGLGALLLVGAGVIAVSAGANDIQKGNVATGIFKIAIGLSGVGRAGLIWRAALMTRMAARLGISLAAAGEATLPAILYAFSWLSLKYALFSLPVGLAYYAGWLQPAPGQQPPPPAKREC
jgi:RHS repeat-associated protein